MARLHFCCRGGLQDAIYDKSHYMNVIKTYSRRLQLVIGPSRSGRGPGEIRYIICLTCNDKNPSGYCLTCRKDICNKCDRVDTPTHKCRTCQIHESSLHWNFNDYILLPKRSRIDIYHLLLIFNRLDQLLKPPKYIKLKIFQYLIPPNF